jgi:hypothetical protein
VVACYGATGLGLARCLRVIRAIPARSIIAATALAAPIPASAHWKLSTRDTTTAAAVGVGAGASPRTPARSSGLDGAVAAVGLAPDEGVKRPAARSSGRTLAVACSGGDTPQLSACAIGTANAAPATTSQPNRIFLRPLVARRPTDTRSKEAMFSPLRSCFPRRRRQRHSSRLTRTPECRSRRGTPHLDGFAAGRALHPH